MQFVDSLAALRLFVGKLSSRSNVTEEACEAVLGLPVSPRRVSARRELIHPGEHVSHSCLIAQGFIARFAQMEDGRRQLIAFHIPGDMVDLHSLMLPAAPSPLMALGATTVLEIPHEKLREVALEHPSLTTAFWRECVVDALVVAEWLVSVGRRNARGRIAHVLCEMACRFDCIGGLNGGRFPLPVTQEQLADAVGLTTVHVNRSLRALREEGLMELTRTEAIILDWDGLVQAAEFNPGYLHLAAPARASYAPSALKR